MLRLPNPRLMLLALCISALNASLAKDVTAQPVEIRRGLPEGDGDGGVGGTNIPGDSDSNWENAKDFGKKVWRGVKGVFAGSGKPSLPPEGSVAGATAKANRRYSTANTRQLQMPVIQTPKFRVSDNLEFSFDTEPLKQSLVDLVNRKFSQSNTASAQANQGRSVTSPVQASSASWGTNSGTRSDAAGFPKPLASFYIFDLKQHRYLSFDSTARRLVLAEGNAVRFGLTEVRAPESTEISMVNTIPTMSGGHGYAGKKVLAKSESEGFATSSGFFLRPLDANGACDGFVATDDRGALAFHDELPYTKHNRVYYERGSTPDETGMYWNYQGWFRENRRAVDEKEFGRFAFAIDVGEGGLTLTSGHKVGPVLHPALGSTAIALLKVTPAPPRHLANFLFLEPDGLGASRGEKEHLRQGVLLHSQTFRFLNLQKTILRNGDAHFAPRLSYALMERNWSQRTDDRGHPTDVASPEAAMLNFLLVNVVGPDGYPRLICAIEHPATGRFLGEQIPDAPGTPRQVDATRREGFIWVYPSKTMPGHWERARYDAEGKLDPGLQKSNPSPQFIDLTRASEKEWNHCLFEVIGIGEHVVLRHLESHRLLRCSPITTSPTRRVTHAESLSLEWGEESLRENGGQLDSYLFRFAAVMRPR